MPFLFPLLAILIWAANTVVSKAAAGVLDPAAISFYRWVIAALALSPFCLPQLWRRRAEIRPWLGKLLVLAALGMCSTSAWPTTPPTAPRPPTWGSSAPSYRC